MTTHEAKAELAEKLGNAFEGMGLSVRVAVISSTTVRFTSDDSAQLEAAGIVALPIMQRLRPNATLSDIYAGRRSAWACDLTY